MDAFAQKRDHNEVRRPSPMPASGECRGSLVRGVEEARRDAIEIAGKYFDGSDEDPRDGYSGY